MEIVLLNLTFSVPHFITSKLVNVEPFINFVNECHFFKAASEIFFPEFILSCFNFFRLNFLPADIIRWVSIFQLVRKMMQRSSFIIFKNKPRVYADNLSMTHRWGSSKKVDFLCKKKCTCINTYRYVQTRTDNNFSIH